MAAATDDNIVATTFTDSEGNFVFQYMQDGEYEIRTEENGVYTSSNLVDATGSDPAPVSVEPEAASLPSRVDAPWNTSLGMINVAELSNNNDNDILVTVTLRSAAGQTISSFPVGIAAQSKYDFILSDVLPKNTYGTVQFSIAGASSSAFRCDIANYRLNQANSGRQVDFAFSIPCQVPKIGNSAVLTNRNYPGRSASSRSVNNWLMLANLASDSQTFTVRSFTEDGVLAATQPVTLSALQRFDLELSRVANITLATVTPDIGSIPYMAILNRYDNGGGASPTLAFGSHAQYGDSDNRCVPISNIVGNLNYTETANVAEVPTDVFVQIYAADGSPIDTGAFALPARGVRHFNFAAQLPVGTAGSVCLSADFPESLIFTNETYYLDGNGELATAFLTTPSKASGVTSIFGAKNFFFSSYNWLRLLNLSDSATTVEFHSDPGDSSEIIASYLLAPHERRDIGLHESPFTRVLDTYGRFRVNGLVSGDLLRVIPNKTNPAATDSVISTSVR